MGSRGNITTQTPRPLSPRLSAKGAPLSMDPSKHIERRNSAKVLALPEKWSDNVKLDPKQQLVQLQQELKKAKEDRHKALSVLGELKKEMASQCDHPSQPTNDRINMLQLDVEKAKESERKMLESVVSQTKMVEETKIALEEAKLEIRNLQETIRSFEASSGRKLMEIDKNWRKGSREEIVMLKNELSLAIQAEDKAKKALDDFAVALKEVSAETNQTKSRLTETELELRNAKAEADHSKAFSKSTEGKMKVVIEESERLKLHMEELLAAWTVKENGLMNCMKVSEDETIKIRQENDKLIGWQRISREENSKLRDILKQAVNEATVLKEALEIARHENAALTNSLSQKERALQSLKHDYESLKITEAAAVDSLNRLKGMLAGGSIYSSNNGVPVNGQLRTKAVSTNGRSNNIMIRVPSDNWRNREAPFDKLWVQAKHRHSIGEPGKFKGSVFDPESSPDRDRDRVFASVSTVSYSNAPSSNDDGEVLDEFDQIDKNHIESMYNETKKKKKTFFQIFGDMLKRRSIEKAH